MRIVKTRDMARRDEAGEQMSEVGNEGIANVDGTEDVKGSENKLVTIEERDQREGN